MCNRWWKRLFDREKMFRVCELARDLNMLNGINFEGATMVGNVVPRFIHFYMELNFFSWNKDWVFLITPSLSMQEINEMMSYLLVSLVWSFSAQIQVYLLLFGFESKLIWLLRVFEVWELKRLRAFWRLMLSHFRIRSWLH